MATIVQINFPFTESLDEYEDGAIEAAAKFTHIDGLLWKIWLVNEVSCMAGGIYHFADRRSAQSYVESDLVARLRSARDNVEVKIFDTIAAAGRVTRSPL